MGHTVASPADGFEWALAAAVVNDSLQERSAAREAA
jgi:hypothetical protein